MADLTKLGKYDIRRELGKGAMGIVYEGFDPLIERVVAIKTIRPEQLDASQAVEILARFKREAQAAGRLNHPNIVAIYEYGEDADATSAAGASSRIAFIAMEFINGRELKDFFDANERFSLAETGRIMGEILGALQHAHSHGVTHRDMKPANVIVLKNGQVKVADFGIARIETSELTQAGTVLGTPAYMSPEQFLGQPVDGRSDIFSCGVMLYQFLTGEKPFTGAVTTIMHKVLQEEPLAPSMLNVTLPQAWDAVVKKAMAKKPGDRYQNAAEFAAAIKGAIENASDEATMINLDAESTIVNLDPDATVANDRTLANPSSLIGQAAAGKSPAAADRTVPNSKTVVTPPPAPAAPRPGPAAASPAPAAAVPPAPAPGSQRSNAMILAGIAVLAVLAGGGYWFMQMRGRADAPAAVAATAPAAGSTAAASAAPAPVQAAALEPGTMVISALGLADPRKFNGDAAAAQTEARADAMRQLVDKALALMVDGKSLDKNYAMVEKKLLAEPGQFIKTVYQEDAPQAAGEGLVGTETRAVVKVREVQKSLNKMSQEERIDFIRNSGDPKISVEMSIRNADTGQAVPADRSQVAENVIKQRISSFGFRVWNTEGETKTGPNAKAADFHIQGEVKVKTLSMKLAASGLTVSKTALNSWTVKAVDKATGEEIYVNTTLPQGQSWANEDQALAAIGKLVGDEFSKNFFLQHFNFSDQNVNLNISGLPGGAASAHELLREFRGIRQILDAQLVNDTGKYTLRLAEGSASDILQGAVLKPLNAKFGQTCFVMGGFSGQDYNVTFAPACTPDTVKAKLENTAPAGLLAGPESRSKALLGRATKTST